MCAEEKIPEINYVRNLQRALDRRVHPSEQDMGTTAVGDPRQTPEEIIDAQNQRTAFTIPANINAVLLDRGRICSPFQLDTDYENIFLVERLSRRIDRPFPEDSVELPVQCTDLMYDWSMACLEDPSPESDRDWPGDIELLMQTLDEFLPERLDLDSWVAREMMAAVGSRVTGWYIPPLELQAWKLWMGYHRTGPIERHGGKVPTIPFLGVAHLGRLVWFPRGGLPAPCTDDLIAKHASITANLRLVEQALLNLSRRIVRFVAMYIIEAYAVPEAKLQGRPIIDRHQIGRAVKEILGEAWFKLPFDVDATLRDWSIDEVLKPDDDLSGSPYLHGHESCRTGCTFH